MRRIGADAAVSDSVALVPTMGYLHEGHLSLIRLARQHAKTVVVSIFVNPTQFSPNEDLATYPRDLEGDASKVAEAGGNILFTPKVSEIYDGGESVKVSLPLLGSKLCGGSRPTHFEGVCQVVLKLFNLVSCQIAVFGEKDFQQLTVLKRLVKDLFLPIRIIPGAIVRESDGLAMSSRNVNLSAPQRRAAPSLYTTLRQMREQVANGETDPKRLLNWGRARLSERSGIELEYLEIVNPITLEPSTKIDRLDGARALVAARFGETRLIDNLSLL